MGPAVELTGVTKSFRNVLAVDSLDLVVPRGAVYGFIGPNGSGKTTTLRMILRIYYPDRGRVVVLGNDHGEAADDRVGYLPEERGLYKKMKVRPLLRYFAALKGMSDSAKAVDSWLDRLGLGKWADQRVESLSKGMSQKVQFIAAVVALPELVILDEPFSGLDPVNRESIKDAVLELRNAGATVIFSTHDMGVAETLCDNIFMIYRGKKVLDGTLDAIQARYGSDTLRVVTSTEARTLAALDGVEQITNNGREKDLRLKQGADAQAVIRRLVAAGPIERVALVRPSLHDIFVRIASPSAEATSEKVNGHV